MGFPRSLERLLSLRQSLERQEEMKLAVISHQLHAANRELSASRRMRHASEAERFDGYENQAGEIFRNASTGGLLRVSEMSRAAALGREQRLADAVGKLEAAHHAQCAALAVRTRQRKILETLRDRHLAAQRRDRLRRDQAALDELFLMRRP